MSSGIGAVYSVPLGDLRALPGTRDAKRARKLAWMIARDFIGRQEIDEMFQGDAPPNTLYQAVRQILSGERLSEDRGTLYGYAVEALCWAVGTTFFLPVGFPTVESFDRLLKERSSPVLLEGLVFSGFPLAIPPPGDFPFAGYWRPEQVVVAAEFFQSRGVEVEDEVIRVGVREVRGWLAEAVKHEIDALVGFYY